MKTYIGTKIIQAEPAYRVSNDHAHHIIVTDPADAYANYPDVEEGYRVRYQDGYESWSPKAAFEEAYRSTDGVNFGLALEAGCGNPGAVPRRTFQDDGALPLCGKPVWTGALEGDHDRAVL